MQYCQPLLGYNDDLRVFESFLYSLLHVWIEEFSKLLFFNVGKKYVFFYNIWIRVDEASEYCTNAQVAFSFILTLLKNHDKNPFFDRSASFTSSYTHITIYTHQTNSIFQIHQKIHMKLFP